MCSVGNTLTNELVNQLVNGENFVLKCVCGLELPQNVLPPNFACYVHIYDQKIT